MPVAGGVGDGEGDGFGAGVGDGDGLGEGADVVGGTDDPTVVFPDEPEPPPQADVAKARADANALTIIRGLCFLVTRTSLAFACLK